MILTPREELGENIRRIAVKLIPYSYLNTEPFINLLNQASDLEKEIPENIYDISLAVAEKENKRQISIYIAPNSKPIKWILHQECRLDIGN